MAGDPWPPLIQGQQLLLRIQGAVMHGHRGDESGSQASNQGFAIPGTAQGGHQAPTLGRGIELAAIGHQVPPAHAGHGQRIPISGPGSLLLEQVDPRGGGEIHQHQVFGA